MPAPTTYFVNDRLVPAMLAILSDPKALAARLTDLAARHRFARVDSPAAQPEGRWRDLDQPSPTRARADLITNAAELLSYTPEEADAGEGLNGPPLPAFRELVAVLAAVVGGWQARYPINLPEPLPSTHVRALAAWTSAALSSTG